MKSDIAELEEKGRAAKAASRRLASLSTAIKNKALQNLENYGIACQLSEGSRALGLWHGGEAIRSPGA